MRRRYRQLLLRGLPPLACEDGSAVASSSSSSSSFMFLDDEEWIASFPRDVVAAALVKRHEEHWHRCRSSLSPGLSHASALVLADKCWLECNGRPLPRDEPLGSSLTDPSFGRRTSGEKQGDHHHPTQNHHVIECRLCTPGGGGDGGSTGAESRSSYLEMYASAKPDAVDPRLLELTRATSCALSGQPLRPPLVADALGSLYNKDAVLSALLARKLPSAMAHVSSLRHVFDARVTEIVSEGTGGGRGGGGGGGGGGDGGENGAAATQKSGRVDGTSNGTSTLSPRFCCPITGIHLNGRNRFLMLRPSGLVVSERAVRVAMPAVEEAAAELSGDSNEGRGEEMSDADDPGKIDLSTAIRLLPPLSELASAREKLLLERAAEAAAKAQKKKKKDKKRKGGGVQEEQDEGGEHEAADEEAERKRRLVAASTAALAPVGADKEVFASLFLSSKKGTGDKETFACRSTALGRR